MASMSIHSVQGWYQERSSGGTRGFLCILLILAFSLGAEAHEDPIGEVYPYVSAEDGKFVIYYMVTGYKTMEPRAHIYQGYYREYYKVEYDSNGEKIAEPVKIEEKESKLYRMRRQHNIDIGLPEKVNGITLREQEDYLALPYKPRFTKPYFLARRDGKYVKEDIKWPDTDRRIIHDAMLIGNQVVLLTTPIDLTGSWAENHLEIVRIDRQTKQIERVFSVGVPGGTGWAPASSNLLYYNGRIFLAWGENYIDGLHVNLSSWKTTDSRAMKEQVSGPVNTNTHLSIAQIGDTAFIAYHYAEDGLHNSVLRTIKIDLKKHFK